LKFDGIAFGALTLYADRPRAFDEQARSHLTKLADDLAYGAMAIRTRADRARVEAELRRIEAYLEEGQRLTHTGSWAWNVATRENVYWSREHYRIFGLDPAEDAQSFEKALERILPDDRAKFIDAVDIAIREKKDFEVDWRIPLPDGTLRHVHSVGHPIIGNDGEVVEFVGTLVDVTEQYLARNALEAENAKRRRVEDELRRSEAFLAEGQRISRTGSWSWNVNTGEASWSAEHFRTFGLDPETTTPSYAVFLERIHPQDRAAFEDMLERAVRRGSDFQCDFRIITPSGITKYVHSLGRVTGNGAGHTEFVGTVMDVTERRIAEEALRSAVADLERASRLSTMGQLTASIAHEINQPLSAIVTNADACLLWLDAHQPNLEEARLAATRIVRNGLRASDIIKSVRALTRKSTPEMAPLDINDVIREVIVLMGAEFRRHAVQVDTSLLSNLDSVLADRVQLQQVVLNLIVNAIEAMQVRSTGSGGSKSEHCMTNPAMCSLRSGIRALGSSWRRRIGFSRHFSPPNRKAWGWDCRSAVRSSTPMAADCGRRPMRPTAQCSNSLFRRFVAHASERDYPARRQGHTEVSVHETNRSLSATNVGWNSYSRKVYS
jgi:signal transduction histidine kinase